MMMTRRPLWMLLLFVLTSTFLQRNEAFVIPHNKRQLSISSLSSFHFRNRQNDAETTTITTSSSTTTRRKSIIPDHPKRGRRRRRIVQQFQNTKQRVSQKTRKVLAVAAASIALWSGPLAVEAAGRNKPKTWNTRERLDLLKMHGIHKAKR